MGYEPDGQDPVPDKNAKKKAKEDEELQFLHDGSINEKTRDGAIASFINRTQTYGDGGTEAGEQLGKVLKDFCETRHKKESKKRENKQILLGPVPSPLVPLDSLPSQTQYITNSETTTK